MNATLHRIEELERRAEWHEAFAHIARVIDWAVTTGQCTESEGVAHLAQMKQAVPLEVFVAGHWTPPVFDLEHKDDTDTMMSTFRAWEQTQRIAP